MIVGEVGYVDPNNLINFVAGKTYISLLDLATNDGFLRKIKIYKGTNPAGDIKVSSWTIGNVPLTRLNFVIVSLPAGTGIVEIDISTLEFQVGQHIGFYSATVDLKGGGAAAHKHVGKSGDLSYTGFLISKDNAPTLWGELHDTPPPEPTDRPFYLGGA